MSSLACCTGKVYQGDEIPQGEVSVVADIKCYFAPKPEGTTLIEDTLIILATDVFGYTLPNSRVLADKFTKETSALCVIPDMFNGSELPPSLMDSMEPLMIPSSFFAKVSAVGALLYHMPGFMYRNPQSKCLEILQRVIKDFRVNKGIKKVAVIGYCWGGSLAIQLGCTDDIDVFVANHPGPFDIPKCIDKLKAPGAYSLTPNNDMAIKQPQCDQIIDLLKKKNNGTYKHQVKQYPTMVHGFAVRGNTKDPETAINREECLKSNAAFIKEVLQI